MGICFSKSRITSTVSFLELDGDVLTNICNYLNLSDVSALQRTCHKLRAMDIFYAIEKVSLPRREENPMVDYWDKSNQQLRAFSVFVSSGKICFRIRELDLSQFVCGRIFSSTKEDVENRALLSKALLYLHVKRMSVPYLLLDNVNMHERNDVRYLDCQDVPYNKQFVLWLKDVFPALRGLRLSCLSSGEWGSESEREFIESLKDFFPRLTKLSLCDQSDSAVKNLVSGFSDWRELELIKTEILSKETFEALGERAPSLKALSLIGCTAKSDGHWRKVFHTDYYMDVFLEGQGLSSLTHLSLRNICMQGATFQRILQNLPSLRYLDRAFTLCSDEDVRVIAAYGTNLLGLQLARCYRSCEELRPIWEKCRNLQRVIVPHARKDEGAMNVLKLCSFMQSVSISGGRDFLASKHGLTDALLKSLRKNYSSVPYEIHIDGRCHGGMCFSEKEVKETAAFFAKRGGRFDIEDMSHTDLSLDMPRSK